VVKPAQEIEIWGTPDCDGIASDRCGWGGFGNGGGGISGEPPTNGGGGETGGGGGGSEQVAQAVTKGLDVRCDQFSGSGDGTSETTSASDYDGRALSAQKIFRQVNVNNGAGTRVSNGTLFTVTYADGGTETWIWTGFLRPSTVPELVVQSTGNLKKGTGKIEPKTCAKA
jgi:hypothetical protein